MILLLLTLQLHIITHKRAPPPQKKEENKERSVCFIVTNNNMNLPFRIIDLYFIAHKTLYKTDHISFTPPPPPL